MTERKDSMDRLIRNLLITFVGSIVVLAAIAAATDGDSVPANLALAENNARVAAEIAVALADLG